MKVHSHALSLLVCVFTMAAADAGEIVGSVRLPAGVDGGRSPAVAYVVTRAPVPPRTHTTIVVDQRDRAFSPRVQAIPLGSSIVFRNSDRESHNVNSQSDCCNFNFMTGPAGANGPVDYESFTPPKAGLMRLLCNIHSQMRGFVMVCPNSLFALADAQGNFLIEHVPDGRHKLVIWQESCQQFAQELEVTGETNLQVELQTSGQMSAPTVSVSTSPVLPWREVLRQITSKLATAARLAQTTGSVSQADSWALDAYFECFEASELETAVLLFRGEERKFVLERMFAKIRRPLLADLAAGKVELGAVESAIDELKRAIEVDIRHLENKGVMDRTALLSRTSTVAPTGNVAHAVGVPQVMSDLREAFGNVARLAERGNAAAAAAALADSYFEVFHCIEPALASHSFAQMRQIEGRFLELRGRIQSGLPPQAVRGELDSLWSQIDSAAGALQRANPAGFASTANRFWNTFLILTREGVEALLIVTALLLYLHRSHRPDGKRSIYGGIVLALVATVVTWTILQWVIVQSGMARETIEGIAALAAGAVLFYVSYWLISKSEARRWQQFLTRQVDRHLSSGSRWAIGLAAFLAVYREGAETILMIQPMLVQPTKSDLAGAIAGAAAAVLALAAIFWALRFASFRLAIRPFFRVTGALLFALAVVLAGKGIAELQEARVLAVSPLRPSLYSFVMTIPSALRDALGITPNVQVLAIQGAILAGAMLSLASMWIIAAQNPNRENQLRTTAH